MSYLLPCSILSFSKSFQVVSENQTNGSFDIVTDTEECTWDAVSNVPWLIVTTPTGTGKGTVYYQVLQNNTEDDREGSIAIGSFVFKVYQNSKQTFVKRDVFNYPILSLDIDGEYNQSDKFSLRANKTKFIAIGDQDYIINYRNTILKNTRSEFSIPEDFDLLWDKNNGPIANPNNMGPCFLWLKPEKFQTNLENTRIISLKDSSLVGLFNNNFVKDPERNGSSVSTGLANYIPITFDGRGVFYYNESENADLAINGSQNFLWGFVVNTKTASTNKINTLLSTGIFQQDDHGSIFIDEENNNRKIGIQLTSNGVTYITKTQNNCYTQNTPFFFTISKINGTFEIRINGGSAEPLDSTINGVPTGGNPPVGIPANSKPSYIGCDILEDQIEPEPTNLADLFGYEYVLIKQTVDTDITQDTRQKLEGYFARKYLVQSTLPSNHPYKAEPARTTVVTQAYSGSPNQPAIDCNYLTTSVSSISFNPESSSSNFSVFVNDPSCGWSITSSVNWLTVNNTSGLGNAEIEISVGENTGSQRTGTITVSSSGSANPVTISVTQEQIVCEIVSISPVSVSVEDASSIGSFTVTTNGSICSWTATTTDNWITITSGASGTGLTGTIEYSVAANTGESRVGTITVGNKTYSIVQDAASSVNVSATGGTITDVDGYRYHTFTSNGSLVVNAGGTVEMLVVGGGGSGGYARDQSCGGGGAGAFVIHSSQLGIGSYDVTVGAGGTAKTSDGRGNNGSQSSLINNTGTTLSVTASGGGGGGSAQYVTQGTQVNGNSGGSGGGGGMFVGVGGSADSYTGTGTKYGNNGGSSSAGGAAGGGGAESVGESASSAIGGNGGSGKSWLNGVVYSGGGGGSGFRANTCGTGGSGGGGNAGNPNQAATSGQANTGSGGGGQVNADGGWSSPVTSYPSGAGGSGIVIVRYPLQVSATGGTVTDVGGYRYHIFTSDDTFAVTTGGEVELLIVAGGGGGGQSVYQGAGGGGAGGVLLLDSANALTVANSTNYSVTVGAGGAGGQYSAIGQNGADSSFIGGVISETAVGGGGGGGNQGQSGAAGGSGGGGCTNNAVSVSGGAGTSGQGNAGGNSSASASSVARSGGGGGGAAAAGGNGADNVGGDGGDGLAIWGTLGGNAPGTYGGGGGGHSRGATAGSGGLGGGGSGAAGAPSGTGSNGTANTGGGGGAANQNTPGAGGSGIVIVRYSIEEEEEGGGGGPPGPPPPSAPPILDEVTIRNNASPTTIIESFSNAVSGDVLLAGGPTSSDVSPTGINLGTVTYQWRRNLINISGATNQTYTLTGSDIDSVISVVVTATNNNLVDTKTKDIDVGDTSIPELNNTNSRIGGVNTPGSYWAVSQNFVNLVYNNVGYDRVWSGGGTSPSLDDNGWPSSALPQNTSWKTTLLLHGTLISVENGNAGTYHETGRKIANRSYASILQNDLSVREDIQTTITLNIYWEGDGEVCLANTSAELTTAPSENKAISLVTFNGPTNQGPFGDGPRQMKKRAWTKTINTSEEPFLILHVISNNPNDNVRNILVLIPGFDELNYKPAMINPKWKEKFGFFKVLRYFSHSFDTGNSTYSGQPVVGRSIDSGIPSTSFWERVAPQTPVVNLTESGWIHPNNRTGYGNISRLENIKFSSSPRAAIEMCNQLNADLWWSHPYNIIRDEGWEIVGDGTNPVPIGERDFWIDTDYISGYATLVNTYLNPGLKVYSEWSNESWNGWGIYGGSKRWAMNIVPRTKYTPPGLDAVNRSQWAGDANLVRFYDMICTAKIAKSLREYISPTREVVCVTNQQDAWVAYTNNGLAAAYENPHTKLLLFGDENTPGNLNGIATAPYRSWPLEGQEIPQITGLSNVQIEDTNNGPYDTIYSPYSGYYFTAPYPLSNFTRWTQGTTPGVDNGYMTVEDMATYWNDLGGKLHYSDPNSFWNDKRSSLDGGAKVATWWWADKWKRLCIDGLNSTPPSPDVEGTVFWENWSRKQWNSNASMSRLNGVAQGGIAPRWNLKLIAYEMGQHNVISKTYQYPIVMLRDLQYHPDYRIWHKRYIEALFASGPQIVNNTLTENHEPLYDIIIYLSDISKDYYNGHYWGLLETVTQPPTERPKYMAILDVINEQPWNPSP